MTFKKTPNPIDIHVGARVRLRRMLVGISQEKLGARLKITFQQVQKYENGTNRISASSLFTIAGILGVEVQFFFQDMPAEARNAAPDYNFDSKPDPQGELVSALIHGRDGFELARAYAGIESPAQRKAVIDLTKAMAAPRGYAAAAE